MMTVSLSAGAEVWRLVVDRAGGRCECTGRCGAAHGKEGRCPLTHDGYDKRRKHHTALVVAHVEPGTSWHVASQAPVSDLRALCESCHDSAVRAVLKAARAVSAQAERLF